MLMKCYRLIIITMDELITIIEERKESINKMKSQSQVKHKSLLVQEQRKRNQRQNWILRVLKTLKVLSNQQKKAIFDTTIKIMNYFQNMETRSNNFQGVNYIETIINLFVEFYNKFEGMDLTHIKTIIRPNNSYIIVDLIKSLVELGRKQFRIAIQQQFKESVMIRSDRKFSEKLMSRSENNLSKVQNLRIGEEIDKKGKKRLSALQISKRINTVLYEKYNKVIDNYNQEYVHEKFNELYFELLYLNNKNSIRIQKYLDSCFGSKRHILYDASGLYTQKQLKKMADEQEEKSRVRAAQIKQLKIGCPIQHLKQYFKIKVQMRMTMNNLPSLNKTPQIRQWLPIIMIKNGDKLHPYNQMIQINGLFYTIQQFQQKNSKKFKVHLKELVKQHFSKYQMINIEDMDFFNKKQYLDYNNAKINELLKQQSSISIIKKQSFLPPINSTSNSENNLKSIVKTRSDSKLPNTSLMIPQNKGSQSIYSILERRMNHTSLAKDKGAQNKRKIDSVIDSIIRARQYTVN